MASDRDILTLTLRGSPELEQALWNAAQDRLLEPVELVQRMVVEQLRRTGYLRAGSCGSGAHRGRPS